MTTFKQPQLHHNMAKPYPEVEAQISKAIELIPTCEKFTIPKLAKEFNVLEQQLQHHLKGVPSKTQQIPVNRKLSEAFRSCCLWVP